MTARVKICGIRTPAALDAAADAGADWVGYVFAPMSPRVVTPAEAAALDAHRRGPARVGLFVDPTDEEVAHVLGAIALDAMQVYSTPKRAADLQSQFDVPVWGVSGIATAADLPKTAAGLDMILLDAKAPAGATRPGGNAMSFNWTVLPGWKAPVPWILAGGLTPGNVATAIRLSGALAVDVSSGVERSPGIKSVELIQAFIEAAHSA